MPYDTSHRAGQLAATLPGQIGSALPPEVAAALRAFGAAQQMTAIPAAEPVQAVIAQAAARAVQAAGTTGSIVLDAAPVAAARAAEQNTRDLGELASAAADAAQLAVCLTVDRHAATLTQAVQHKHGEVVTELAALAAELPPDVDDRAALEHGDPLRARFLRARDLTAQLALLRDLLGIIWPGAAFRTAPGSLEQAVTWCRSPWAYDQWHLAPGEPGSLAFVLWLVAGAGADAVWCPTISQIETRVAQLIEEQRLDRIAALPGRGAKVW